MSHLFRLRRFLSFVIWIGVLGLLSLGFIACGGTSTDAPSLVDLTPSGPSVGEAPEAVLFCEGDRRTTQFTGTIFNRPPNVATCDPGSITPEAAQFMLDRLNFLRGLHALPPVGLNQAYLEQAQQAALMTLANDTINHNPPSTWRCFTEAGQVGAQSSNLSGGPLLGFGSLPDEIVLARQVDIYLAEPGAMNFTDVGHRRWMLYPQYAEGAFAVAFDPGDGGAFNQANANWVFGFDNERSDPDVGFIAFPERDGYLYRLAGFSGQPLSAYRWSFSVAARGDEADLSNVQILITDTQTGEAIPVFDIREADPAFGLATVTYSVSEVQPNRLYQFDIIGAVIEGQPRTYQYQTTLYECGTVSTEFSSVPTEVNLGAPPNPVD